jgi:hypothetical protein
MARETPATAPADESHTERVSNVRGVTLLGDEELLFGTRLLGARRRC